MSGKNSIQVAIKVRPLIKKEKDQQWRIINNSIQLIDSQSEPYYFDHIFDQDATNQVVFDKMVKQIVHSAIQGFNGTIFAYGQTSSGKTYTMMGDESNPGVMVLTAKEIFHQIERTQDRQFLLRVGYIEIYNEKIYDLLDKKNQDLKIHETSTGIVSVNCEESIIRSEDDLLNHLNKGNKERTVGETNMNERSSRSHAIFRIIIESRKMDRNEEDDAVIQSVINLVDLAGSERADQTGATGTRLKEGGHINKSLLFLSNVIKRLSENEDDKYISYRDSKLTRILQASLGGNALTAIICTIKPNAIEETQSTLNFALRAKTIKNKPHVNEIVSDATMMKRLEHEIKVLRSRLEEEQRKNESQIKVRVLEERIKMEDLKIISCNSLLSLRKSEKRRRTWCPSTANLDTSSCIQQPSALPVPTLNSKLPSTNLPQLSRLQPPKHSYYNTPLITLRPTQEPSTAPQLVNGLPKPPENMPEIDEEFAPAELVNFELLTPLQTPRNQQLLRHVSITPKITDCPLATRNELQAQLDKLTDANKKAGDKIVKYETELAELKKTNQKLEMENREAVNLEFEFQRHKNKSKLRETELLEALKDKEKEVTKLEKSLNTITAERLQNTKEKLLRRSLNKCEADESGEVCVKCKDLERLLEENQKVILEFEKLTLEYENLKLNYTEIEKENETNKSKITHLEEIQEKEKADSEKLLEDIHKLRDKLHNVQQDFEQLSNKNSSKNEECMALSRQVEVAREEMVVLEEKFAKLETSWQVQQQTLSDIEIQYANIQTKYEQLQSQYDQLELTRGQSLTDCQRLEKENVELQTEIEDLKKKVQDAQQKLLESNEKFEASKKENAISNTESISENSNLREENKALKQQLLEIQTQFDDLQKEYDDLSNQLMDNLQESESLKIENTKLQEKLKEYDMRNAEVFKTEAEINELKSQLEKVLSSENKQVLKTPSPSRNSSMRSSGVCVREVGEDLEQYTEDMLNKFCELSESLTEIELEHIKGKSKIFKSASKNSTPNYKMYLKNIMGVRKSQKEFDMEIENIHLQGSFKHHSFHIVELSGEDKSYERECDNIEINGCDNIAEYIEKLKQEIVELKAINEQERSNNKSMLESTERAFIEMREQIQQLSAELLEKSIFVENCACKTYQQQIETLEKEKTNMTIACEELQEKVNGTFNDSVMNTTSGNEIKNVADGKLKEFEQLKLREQELLESFDSQTKMLEELTQRYLDMENDLQTANEQLENQEKEHKERCNQLQLEILEKLEISANENRENMKKYNKEWEVKKEEYEQIITDLRNQVEQLNQLKAGNQDLKISNEIQQENDGNNETVKIQKDITEGEEKKMLEEVKQSLELQLRLLEEQLEIIKQENNKYCEEEIPLLNSKIVTLEEQLKDSLQNQSILNSEKASIETEMKELKNELQGAQQLSDKNQQLTDEINKLNEDYKQVQEELSKAERQIQELCEEDLKREEIMQSLQNKLTKVESMEEEKKSLADEVDILRKTCSELQESLNTLQENNQKTLKENEVLTQENTTLQEYNEQLSTNQSELLLKKCALEEKLQQITSELNLHKADSVIHETQLNKLEDANNTLQQKYSELQQENCSLIEKLKCLKEKEQSEELVEQIIKEKAEISQNLRLVTENIESLKKLLEHKEQEINKAKEEKAGVENDLHSLRESLLKTIEQKQQQLKDTENEKDKVEQDRINICYELQELKQTLAKANEENTNLKKELETLEYKLSVLLKEKSEQQLELEKAKDNQNNVQKDLESFRDSLSKALTKKQQEFESLEHSNRSMQKEIHSLNADLTSSKEDKEQLLKEIENLQQEHIIAKESLVSLTDELEKLQKQLEGYKNIKEEKVKLETTLNILKTVQTSALNTLQQERNYLQNTVEQYKQQEEDFKEKEETLTQKIETLNQRLHEFRCKAQANEKLLLEHEEIESALTKVNAVNQTLQDEVSQLTTQQENYISNIKNLSDKIESINSELDKHLNEKKELEIKLFHLKETHQVEKSLLQLEQQQLKSYLDELQLKYDSLQTTNTQLQNLNHQLKQQVIEMSDKLQELNNLQDELNSVKGQNIELEHNLKVTIEGAGRCSLALQEEIEQHKALMNKQQDNFNKIKNEIETKYHSLEKVNLKLSSDITTLQSEKLSLENKLREITVRNFELDLQRQVIDATSNTSLESNASSPSKGRRSIGGGDIKSANTSLEDKLSAIQQKNLTAERKNRRLSTHDERRRQSSYWGAVHDKETMTDGVDTSCNCIELDRKLKETERNLFIKNSQVTALNMHLKNHPLKEENTVLIKRLQEEQEKHQIEIKRYKNKLYEQTTKTEKALAAAAIATSKSAQMATNAEKDISSTAIIPKVVADVEVQTNDELSVSLQALQGKYNDLKNICRYRYNVIKELEDKVSQKENADVNSLSALEAAQYNVLLNQCESLKKELKAVKEKYEFAKKVLQGRREEIQKLRAQLDQAQ